MSLINLVIIILLAGFLWWLIDQVPAIDGTFKTVLRDVVSAAGFEPAAPRFRGGYSTQTELRAEKAAFSARSWSGAVHTRVPT